MVTLHAWICFLAAIADTLTILFPLTWKIADEFTRIWFQLPYIRRLLATVLNSSTGTFIVQSAFSYFRHLSRVIHFHIFLI